MAQPRHYRSRFALLALATALFTGQALADKPSWAGGGKHGRGGDDDRRESRYEERYEGRYQSRHEGRDEDRDEDRHRERRYEHREERHHDGYPAVSIDFRFDDHSRVAIRDYYGERFQGGHCPPGLAKKRNGCLPPGQAKKWRHHQPLPPGVVYYDLPPALIGHLPPPPPQHRYVRVASDILLISVGTAMVVDAIEDLGR